VHLSQPGARHPLRDERFVIVRTIVAITDLPRVCPRKLPKLASLSLGEALSLSHRSACRDSPDKGDTMYKSLVETDSPIALTVAFAAVLTVVGVIARALRWAARAPTNKSNTRPPFAESI
jgi:hypothetical protein